MRKIERILLEELMVLVGLWAKELVLPWPRGFHQWQQRAREVKGLLSGDLRQIQR